MRAAVEAPLDEMTQKFKGWAADRVDIYKTLLSIELHKMDCCLNHGVPMSDYLLDNNFKFVYSSINDSIYETKAMWEDSGLSDDVMSDIIDEFKLMRASARKAKAEYKRKFAELRAAIEQAKSDSEYAAHIKDQVQEFIAHWCNTYAIKKWRKAEFSDEKMPATVAWLTNWIMSRKLNLSSDEVAKLLEEYMGDCTLTAAN